jgi:hypothetical protein
MIRLNKYTEDFRGIELRNCGLLFVSTPHSGSSEADWNKYIVDIAELFLGVRSDTLVKRLQSFNNWAVEKKREFGNLKPLPPFFCLCEGKKTRVGLKLRTVSS